MAVQTSSISSTLPYTTLKVVDKDYQAASKVLQETTHRWTVEWKAACDKYQDLEEERIDFLKGNLWTFANIMSTVCVSDDEACEKIRVSLEKCEVDEVIQSFVQAKATGQEIPGPPSSPFRLGADGLDPPKYKNFYRKEEQDDEAAYKVAQFSRDGNPQYRSSTPQAYAPSDDEMARPMTGMYRQDDDMRPMTGMSMHEPTRPMTGMSVRHEERSMTGMAQRMDESPRPGTGVPRQEDAPRPLTGVPRQDRPSTALPAQSRPATGIPRQDRPSTGIPDSSSRNPSPQRGRPSTMSSVLDSDSPPSSHRSRSRGGSQSPLKGVINEYPEEGITQFCRSDSGRLPPHRNDSRHSSASSTYSSSEAPSQQSANTAASSQGSFSTPNKNGPSPKVLHRPDKSEGKSPTKKSSFWSFTKSPKQSTPKTLPTIQAPLKTSKSAPSGMALTTPSLEIGGDPQPAERYQRVSNARRRDRSEEPIVPGSSVMLNIGDNMLEVNNPDSRPAQPKFEELEDEADPLVAALADLKIASKTPRIPSPSKRDSQFAPSSSQRSDQFQPSSSQRSDHFHPSSSQRSDDLPLYDSPVRDNSSSSRSSTSQTLRQQQPSPSRGQPAQPPPSFDSRRNTLGAPPPAHSAAEMERTRRQYASQVQQVLGGPARPPTSQQVLPPRSTSPRPGSRQSYGGDSYGARPGSAMGMTAGIPPRSRSPNPHEMVPRSRSPAPIARPASRQEYARPSSRQDYAPPRPASRQEYARPASRQEFARPTSRQEYARPTSRQDYDARRRSVSPAPYAGRYDDRSPSPAPVPRSLSPAPRPRSQAAVASNNAFGISLDRYGNVVGDQPAARGGGQYAYGAQHRHDLDLGPGERGAPPPAQQARARSKSQSDVRSRGKYTEDGRLILFAGSSPLFFLWD